VSWLVQTNETSQMIVQRDVSDTLQSITSNTSLWLSPTELASSMFGICDWESNSQKNTIGEDYDWENTNALTPFVKIGQMNGEKDKIRCEYLFYEAHRFPQYSALSRDTREKSYLTIVRETDLYNSLSRGGVREGLTMKEASEFALYWQKLIEQEMSEERSLMTEEEYQEEVFFLVRWMGEEYAADVEIGTWPKYTFSIRVYIAVCLLSKEEMEGNTVLSKIKIWCDEVESNLPSRIRPTLRKGTNESLLVEWGGMLLNESLI
jgi:hypothetical protein